MGEQKGTTRRVTRRKVVSSRNIHHLKNLSTSCHLDAVDIVATTPFQASHGRVLTRARRPALEIETGPPVLHLAIAVR